MRIQLILWGLISGGLLLAAPGFAHAETTPLPSGFISLASVRAGRAAIITVSHAVTLRADASPIPSGFLPLDRDHIRPLTPSRGINLGTAGSIHTVIQTNTEAAQKIIAKDAPVAQKQSEVQTLKANEEDADNDESDEDTDETALREVGNAEREMANAPIFSDVVRHIGSVAYAWPLPKNAEQRFASAFGMRSDPFTHKPKFHEGIDLAAHAGTPVLAAADGTVETVTRGHQFGNYVTIKHRDGSTTTYGHLRLQSVSEGQRVMQGQKVGEVGSTGRSTAAHLHFQVEQGGKPVNPLAFASLIPPWTKPVGLASIR